MWILLLYAIALIIICCVCCVFFRRFLKREIVARGYLYKYEYILNFQFPKAITVVYLQNGENFILRGYHLIPCGLGERIKIINDYIFEKINHSKSFKPVPFVHWIRHDDLPIIKQKGFISFINKFFELSYDHRNNDFPKISPRDDWVKTQN